MNLPNKVQEIPTKPRTIFAALSKAQRMLAAVGIPKADANKSQGWKFRGIDATLNALSPILAETGLICLPNVVRWDTDDKPKGTAHKVTIDWTFYDSEGDSVKFREMGESIDYGDKGFAKAQTASYKYMIFIVFCVPLIGHEFGDGDEDSPEEQQPETNLKVVKNRKPTDALQKSLERIKKKVRITIDGDNILVAGSKDELRDAVALEYKNNPGLRTKLKPHVNIFLRKITGEANSEAKDG